MRFNVYALNWNESRLLPAFLHHYRQAHRLVVYDNESDDDSEALVLAAGREFRRFSTQGQFDDTENMRMKNTIWKDARLDEEKVDFVVVQDLDEFLYFPASPSNLLKGFEAYRRAGVTCAQCVCYHMVCSDEQWDRARLQREAFGAGLVSTICQGNRDTRKLYDKVLVFDPHAIVESMYTAGAHSWKPTGKIVYAEDRPLLLHYKYTGLQYNIERYKLQGQRLSALNKVHGYGTQYMQTDDQTLRTLQAVYAAPRIEVTRPLRVMVVVGVHLTVEFLSEACEDAHLHVFAIDADADIIAAIHEKFSPPDNYHLVATAVSDHEGEAEFNVCSNTTCSSLLKWGNGPRFGTMTPRRVQCTTMRRFINKYHLGAIDYLLVDAQGHDLSVLQGFGDRFRVVKRGTCGSMAPGTKWSLYEGQPTFEQLDSFLEEQGYDRTWEYNTSGGCPRDEVNVHFTQRPQAQSLA